MIPRHVAAAIVNHARRDWPREACGFVLRRDHLWTHLPANNLQDLLHEQDPARHPRTAAEAFLVDAETLIRAAEYRKAGDQIAVIYHSHTRAWGANFSDEDRRGALGGLAVPQFPEALYLVVSVRETWEWMARGYRWQGGDFVEDRTESLT